MPLTNLDEVKQYYPKGYSAPNMSGNNAFESNHFVNSKNQAHGVNTNHGWKLHADLKAQLTEEEAYAKLGLKLRDPSGGITKGVDVVDQELYLNFEKRTSALGVNLRNMSEKDRQKWLYKFLLNGGRENIDDVAKFVDPNDTLRLVELLGENDIGFKTSSSYGSGRHFTFYAQSIEERDRIIGALEGSDIADRLEDQYDPNYRKTIREGVEEKNAPISQKTSGRFTTDYLNPHYVDDSGRPYLDLQHDSESLEIKDQPGRTPANPAQVEENKKLLIKGTLDTKDMEAVEQVKNNFPEMDELLRGKPGYTTPYSTIEDQIAWRQANGVMGYDEHEFIKPRPTATTGPTPGSVPSQPTVTTGETPGRKPVGRPVTTANTPSPPPTATQARETAEKVTKSGNATPPPKATIQSTAPTPSRPSSGAPVKSPGRLRTAADDLSAAVTQGPNGARNLKMLGIAGALGVAGFGVSRFRGSAQDDEETRRRLEMQRRGTM